MAMSNIRDMQYLPNYGGALTQGLQSGQNIRKQVLKEQAAAQKAQSQAALSQLAGRAAQGDKGALQQLQSIPGGLEAAQKIATLDSTRQTTGQNKAKATEDYYNQMARQIDVAPPELQAKIHDEAIANGLAQGILPETDRAEIGNFGEDDLAEIKARVQSQMTPYQKETTNIQRERLDIDRVKAKKERASKIPLTFDKYFSERLEKEIGSDEDELSADDTNLVREVVLENMRDGMDLNQAFGDAINTLGLEETGTRWGANFELTGEQPVEQQKILPKKVEVPQQGMSKAQQKALKGLQKELEELNKLEKQLLGNNT